MSRLVLNYLLPLVLPLALYLSYIWWRHRHKKKHGDTPPQIENTHIFISIVIGFIMMTISLTWVAIFSGETPGLGTYQSPRYEDGKITAPSFR